MVFFSSHIVSTNNSSGYVCLISIRQLSAKLILLAVRSMFAHFFCVNLSLENSY